VDYDTNEFQTAFIKVVLKPRFQGPDGFRRHNADGCEPLYKKTYFLLHTSNASLYTTASKFNKSKDDTEVIGYLRDLAHRCSSLARRCSDRSVSHELEGIGAELMEKAHELEQSDYSPPTGSG
jgi:hypothetical protein